MRLCPLRTGSLSLGHHSKVNLDLLSIFFSFATIQLIYNSLNTRLMFYIEKTPKSLEFVPSWVAGRSPPLKWKSILCKMVIIIYTSENLLGITVSRSEYYHKCYCFHCFPIWRKNIIWHIKSIGVDVSERFGLSISSWNILVVWSYVCYFYHMTRPL